MVKSGINAVRNISSGVQFLNVLKLTLPFHWKKYLKHLLDTHQNRKAFDRCGHADIQELLRQQANEQFKNDSELLKRALAEVSRPHLHHFHCSQCLQTAAQANKSAFADSRARRSVRAQNSANMVGPLADQVAALRIPRLCHSIKLKSQGNDDLSAQTYRSFADQTKQKNTNVVFTKELMDATFLAAASKMPKNMVGGRKTHRERMVSRVSLASLLQQR